MRGSYLHLILNDCSHVILIHEIHVLELQIEAIISNGMILAVVRASLIGSLSNDDSNSNNDARKQ